MIFLDIETTTFFQDPEIKALPRTEQIAAMRFGCAVTCRIARPGYKLYRVSDLSNANGDLIPVSFIVDARSTAEAKLDAAGQANAFWNSDTVADPIDGEWREWGTAQVAPLYNYLCWAGVPVCGWNIAAFDWPVILANAQRAGVELLEIEHETVQHIDLFDFIRQKTGRWYKLEDAAQVNLGRGKLADGQLAAEWLRSGDPGLAQKAMEYCRHDVQLTMDLAAILQRGEPLRLPPRVARRELSELRIWQNGEMERIPDASGAISTR